jgi:DNA-binding HxlR family transcriptional regulator
LTLTLKELEQDGLIARKVITNVRPAQAYYSLTERGLKIAKLFVEIRDSLAGKG